MLYAILGDFGSGKTLFLTLIGFSTDKEILGNYSLDLDNYTKIDPIDLQNFGFDKVVLLDELYTWLDSRVSTSFINRYISYILLQCRHRDIDVYGTLQMFGSADVRFRDMVNRVVKCSRIPKRNVHHLEWDFKYEILNTYSGKEVKHILTYEKAKAYFPFFDTYEIVESEDKAHLDLEMLKKYPRKLYTRLSEIALEIKKRAKSITHDSIKLGLLKEGYNIEWEGLVYSCLKEMEV